jgi:hypothetical protein
MHLLGTLNTKDFALAKQLRKLFSKGLTNAPPSKARMPALENVEILFIYDDAIRAAFTTGTIKTKYILAVGEAVLEAIHLGKLSLQPASANLFNYFHCVNFVREVPSLDPQLFLWAGNTLRALDQLQADDLALVDRLIDDERERRASRTPSRVKNVLQNHNKK